MSFIRKISKNIKPKSIFILQSMLVILAALFYLSSLFLPSVNKDTGFSILGTGWLGLFAGRLSWLCNLYFIITIFKVFYNFSAKRMTTTANVVLAITFALLALETLLYGSWPTVELGPEPAVFHLGYYLWVSSFWLLAIRTLIKYYAEKRVDVKK